MFWKPLTYNQSDSSGRRHEDISVLFVLEDSQREICKDVHLCSVCNPILIERLAAGRSVGSFFHLHKDLSLLINTYTVKACANREIQDWELSKSIKHINM